MYYSLKSTFLPFKTFRAKQYLLAKSLVQPGTTNALHTIVTVYQGTPTTSVAEVQGKRVVYGVYQRSHIGLVRDHLLREVQQYVLMKGKGNTGEIGRILFKGLLERKLHDSTTRY